MDRLSSVVVIAGKNGAGKTRLLEVLEYAFKNMINEQQAYSHSMVMERWRNEINEGKIKEEQIIGLREQYENALTNRNSLILSEELSQYNVVHFVPKSIELKDCNDLGKHKLITLHDSLNGLGQSKNGENTFAYIQVEQNRYYSATHQNSKIPPEEREKVVKSYVRLNELVRQFLGVELTRENSDDDCQIFGRSLGKAGLSNGQTILLQLCVAIHAQGASLKNLVLILDEPENHLHPSALIEFVKTIMGLLKNGQIWIATHSISLLAIMEPTNIFYMENNAVEYAGKTPETVLKGLLGDEENLAKLTDFLSLPSTLASIRFAHECLFSPTVVTTGSEDKQMKQVRDHLQSLKASQGKVKVLDYGAGKGRIADALYANEENKDGLKDWLHYIAFDKFQDDKEICKGTISSIYGNHDKRYYNTVDSLCADHDKNSFDFVIMCNVLHEIPHKEWPSIFTKTIAPLLKDDGFLYIVEHLVISVGEKPHQKGFLVLNKGQIKELFCIKESDKFGYEYAQTNKSLLACSVPKDCVARITKDSVDSALKSLHEHAKEEIIKLRGENDYKNGRLHAFWSQQLSNIIIALD